MLRESLRPLAAVVTLAWIVSGTHSLATAWHVASDHGAAAHGGGAAPGAHERLSHSHASGHGDHAHGLLEMLPGVRRDPRPLATAALDAPAGVRLVSDDDVRVARGIEAAPAPDPPPRSAPAVRLL